jgi:DNA-binding NarL/FixJ family response regulator
MGTDAPAPRLLLVDDHDFMRAGLRFVLEGSGFEEVVGAVEAVLGGETPIDQRLAMRLLRRLSESADGHAGPRGVSPPGNGAGRPMTDPLSAREREVLRLMALGKTNRQLAADLRLSLSSVKTYVQRVIKKLGVSDRTQASVRALEMGLLAEGG